MKSAFSHQVDRPGNGAYNEIKITERDVVIMASLPFTEARNGFSKMLDRVADKKERISLSRRGKVVAAVIPIEDLALLERLRAEEDAEDIREADKAYRRYKRTGKAIPWEQIKKEAGLL